MTIEKQTIFNRQSSIPLACPPKIEMKKNLHWIVLATSLCFTVSIVIVSLLFQRGVETRLSTEKQVTNEFEKISEGSRNSHRNVSQSGMKADRRLNIGVDEVSQAIADESPSPESSTQDALEEKSNATTPDVEEDDEVMREYQRLYRKKVEGLRARIEKSIARINPLFEEMDFYESQLEPLKRQRVWNKYSAARRRWKELTHEALDIYVFLRQESLKEWLGDLYLSTPQYSKLMAFCEDWDAKNPGRPVRR